VVGGEHPPDTGYFALVDPIRGALIDSNGEVQPCFAYDWLLFCFRLLLPVV